MLEPPPAAPQSTAGLIVNRGSIIKFQLLRHENGMGFFFFLFDNGLLLVLCNTASPQITSARIAMDSRQKLKRKRKLHLGPS
jgi:hypothetical protein